MKLVTSREELKVGDKLVFTENIYNNVFKGYCYANNVLYVVVSNIIQGESYISLTFINHKGMIINKDYPITPLYKKAPRFYYYEGS